MISSITGTRDMQ
jgi:prohibitin 1